MTARGVTLGFLLVALIGTACSGDDTAADPTTTSSSTTTTSSTEPERPASTTTTAFDPASVEGEVEAAYLRSWDVYADAAYHLELDEDLFAEVYAEEHLQTKLDELRGRIRHGRAAHVRIGHDYELEVISPTIAAVLDTYVNHQVLIDAQTKKPIEDDPDEQIARLFTLIRGDDERWRLSKVERI